MSLDADRFARHAEGIADAFGSFVDHRTSTLVPAEAGRAQRDMLATCALATALRKRLQAATEPDAMLGYVVALINPATPEACVAPHERAEALSRMIAPLLAGQPPEQVSVALADLSAMLIAGHHPDIREAFTAAHVKLIGALVPLALERMTESGRAPANWSRPAKERA